MGVARVEFRARVELATMEAIPVGRRTVALAVEVAMIFVAFEASAVALPNRKSAKSPRERGQDDSLCREDSRSRGSVHDRRSRVENTGRIDES